MVRTGIPGILLAISSLTIGLLLGEFILRQIDPLQINDRPSFTPPIIREDDMYTIRLEPGVESEFRGDKYIINAEGFRTPVVPRTKPANTLRIAIVGDSVAFGWGVPAESSFPRLLEFRLNEGHIDFAGKNRVEVINLSVPGWDLKDYFNAIHDYALAYDPDLIMITLIDNDIPVNAFQKDKPFLRLPIWLQKTYSFQAAALVADKILRRETAADYRKIVQATPEAVELTCFALGLIKQAAGDRPLVMIDTVGSANQGGIPEIAECTEDLAVGHIEAYFDETYYLENIAVDPPFDFHPNELGHSLITDAIITWFEEFSPAAGRQS